MGFGVGFKVRKFACFRGKYAPVVKKLRELKKQNKNLKVLEVGSGSKGITRFFKHHITGIDIEKALRQK